MKLFWNILTLSISLFVFPAIVSLLLVGSPSTILWRIRAIVVNPIQSFPFRPIAHIGVKVFEGIAPPFAHCYSSTPIAVPILTLGVTGSILCSVPRLVGSRKTHSVFCILDSSCGGGFSPQTATTRCGSDNKSANPNFYTTTTSALTFREGDPFNSPHLNHCQSSVNIADVIFLCWHGYDFVRETQ